MPDGPISWVEALARVDEALAEVSALRHYVRNLEERQAQIMRSLDSGPMGAGQDGTSEHHVTDTSPTKDH